MEEISSRRDALAHQNLVGGAANPGQVDAFGAGSLRIFNNLRILGGGDNHFTKCGFMSVDNDVDHIIFEYTKVGLAQNRRRGTEEDIRNIRREQAAAPPIC